MAVKKKYCQGCSKLSIIWSTKSGKRLCKVCDSKNKPVNKSKKLLTIKKVSDKRAIQDKIYLEKRIIFLKKYTQCMINVPGVNCGGKLDIHHTFCGKDRQKYYTDEITWLLTCRNHHNWIHENSKLARELNYLK